jgi:hypothetical protein
VDQQSLITILVGLLSLTAGAIIGGGTAIVIYGRAVRNVLASPVIMTSLEQLAKSWPAPVRDAVADTGRFLTEVTDDKPAGLTPPLSAALVKSAEPVTAQG